MDYYFVLNHAGQSVTVSPGAGFTDLLESAPAPARFTLKPFEYRVLRRAAGGSARARTAGARGVDRAASP